jgi:hypothetical protein
MLKILKTVNTNNYRLYIKIIEAIKNKEAIVLDKEIHSIYYREYEITDEKLYPTYDGDTDLTFSYSQKLICKMKVYNTQRCYDTHKFDATIKLPDSFLKNIEDIIKYNITKYFEEEYEEMLENKKQKWIKDKISLI